MDGLLSSFPVFGVVVGFKRHENMKPTNHSSKPERKDLDRPLSGTKITTPGGSILTGLMDEIEAPASEIEI